MCSSWSVHFFKQTTNWVRWASLVWSYYHLVDPVPESQLYPVSACLRDFCDHIHTLKMHMVPWLQEWKSLRVWGKWQMARSHGLSGGNYPGRANGFQPQDLPSRHNPPMPHWPGSSLKPSLDVLPVKNRNGSPCSLCFESSQSHNRTLPNQRLFYIEEGWIGKVDPRAV